MAKNRGGTESIMKKIKALNNIKNNFPTQLARSAVKFFKDSFSKQGWDYRGVTRWKKRKGSIAMGGIFVLNSKEDKSRPTLVKSGKLKRSIRIKSADWNQFTIISDMPYSAIHNNGGTINHPGGTKYLWDWKTKKMIFVEKSSIYMTGITKPHKIPMPRRRFMGDSYTLRKLIDSKIVSKINTVMRTK